MAAQTTDSILLVRPSNFGYNEETASNNSFQKRESQLSRKEISERAISEFDNMVQILRQAHLSVEALQDTFEPEKPDAVFPNNWVSFHENGAIITYPLFSAKRRPERREEIIDFIEVKYGFQRRYSFEQYETKSLFLEGTGSMVLDRINRKVYSCFSPRTDPTILDKFCALMDYNPVMFTAKDSQGIDIYHTNVMMAIGEGFVVLCLDSLVIPDDRVAVIKSLKETKKEIIEISLDQMNAFAGNLLPVRNAMGESLIVLSEAAFQSLTNGQQDSLSSHGKLIVIPIYSIEYFGGGSIRCMVAEIFKPIEMT